MPIKVDVAAAGYFWNLKRRTHWWDAVITDLLDGQYSRPLRVISFNTAEGWSRDVSEEMAHELRRRSVEQDRELPATVEPFVERYAGQNEAEGLPPSDRFPPV